MTEDDFLRIEDRLGMKLPAVYRRAMSTVGEELLQLALDYRSEIDDDRPIFLTADRLIASNLSERLPDSGTGYAFPDWWKKYFLIGTNGAGGYYCLLLKGKSNLWMIGSDCGDEPVYHDTELQTHISDEFEYYREEMAYAEHEVAVASLPIDEWRALKEVKAATADLGEDYGEFKKRVEQPRFEELIRQRKSPRRISIEANPFLAWCELKQRIPDAASREAFAEELMLQKYPYLAKRQSR